MVAVIGDIHGCLNTLKDLVDKIKKKYPGIEIFSVGDLIDRGNFSFEVIEYIQKEKIRFTPGNHDFMFYYFIKFPASSMGNSWLFNGYEPTVRSYNGRENKMNDHLSVIEKAPLFFNLEDCFISHAGVSKEYKSILPKDPISDIELFEKTIQSDLEEPHSIIWARGELLNIGKLQIVGHTRREEIYFDKNSNALYIDTSAYSGNLLSAVIIEKNERIETISVITKGEDIE